MRIEPTGGVVLIRGKASFETFGTDPRFSGNAPTRGHNDLDWNPGFMLGSDIRIGGERLAILTGVRFMFTGLPTGTRCIIGFAGDQICSEDSEPYSSQYYPIWTQRPSVSLAVSFQRRFPAFPSPRPTEPGVQRARADGERGIADRAADG
jgi:hypothetical protein